jgi:hypothetical protein
MQFTLEALLAERFTPRRRPLLDILRDIKALPEGKVRVWKDAVQQASRRKRSLGCNVLRSIGLSVVGVGGGSMIALLIFMVWDPTWGTVPLWDRLDAGSGFRFVAMLILAATVALLGSAVAGHHGDPHWSSGTRLSWTEEELPPAIAADVRVIRQECPDAKFYLERCRNARLLSVTDPATGSWWRDETGYHIHAWML